jgi:hypothetical protein
MDTFLSGGVSLEHRSASAKCPLRQCNSSLQWHLTAMMWISSTSIVLRNAADSHERTGYVSCRWSDSKMHNGNRKLRPHTVLFFSATRAHSIAVTFKYRHCVPHCCRQRGRALHYFLSGGSFSERSTASANYDPKQLIFYTATPHCVAVNFKYK